MTAPDDTAGAPAMEDDPLVKAAMTILIEAGKGRTSVYRSLRAVEAGDFAAAQEHIKQAHTELEVAHRVHTDQVQEEAGGARAGYSMLFTHAQDTMMTAYSEYRIVKRLVPILTSFDARITALEEKR